MADAFGTFLGRSLAALRAGRPKLYQGLIDALGERSIAVTVDGEPTGLVVEKRGLVVRPVPEPSVAAVTTGDCVLRLVDGEETLLDAVRAGHLDLAGAPADLVLFNHALELFVNGAVRVAEMKKMLSGYRRSVRGRGDPSKEDGAMSEDDEKKVRSQFPNGDSKLAVTVFGAGVAGLTVAHELVERGFRVQVWEPNPDVRQPDRGSAVGGMARSQWSSADRPVAVDNRPKVIPEEWANREARPLEVLPFRFYLKRDPHAPQGLTVTASGVLTGANGRTRYTTDKREVLDGLYAEVERRRLKVLYAEGIFQQAFFDEWPGPPKVPSLNTLFHTKIDDAGGHPPGKPVGPDHWKYQVGDDLTVDFFDRTLPLPDPTAWFDGDPATVGMARFLVREYQLPGEHGYRFFPAFYHHLFDTLKRIPLLQAVPKAAVAVAQERSEGVFSPDKYDLVTTGKTVFDNIVPATSQAIAYGDGHQPPVFPRFRVDSFEEMLRQVGTLLRWRVEMQDREAYARSAAPKPVGVEHQETWRMRASGMGITPRDMARFYVRLIKYLGSCPNRRQQYERMSWWEFLEADTFSPNFQKGQNEWPRALIAMSALEVDARTHGDAVCQLLMDQIRDRGYRDGVLNGPTSEAWFEPWRTYLEQQGVEFKSGSLEGFRWIEPDGQLRLWPNVRAIDPRTGNTADNQDLMDGYFVVALPVEKLQPLAAAIPPKPKRKLGRDLRRAAEMPLGTRAPNGLLTELDSGHSDGTPLRNFHGIQFYFDEELTWLNGHTFFAHAPWGLSAVTQSRFWADRPTWEVGYRGILSVIVGVWDRHGLLEKNLQRTAWETPPADLAEEIWHQISQSVRSAPGYGQNFNVPVPRLWRLNENLVWLKAEKHYRNQSPFLISRPGEWSSRPGQLPELQSNGDITGGYDVFDGIVLAGTHMKTFTRLTSMEAANESGRHAANAVLADANLRTLEGVVPVWSMEERELPDILWLKQLDARYLARGLRHPIDEMGVEDLLVSSQPGVLRHPDAANVRNRKGERADVEAEE